MINFLKYKLYSLLSSDKLRSIMLFAAVFLLSGCDNAEDTSAGKDNNISEQANCWQTQIAHTVTHALDTLYKFSADKVVKGGANLVLVGFAVWLAFKLLKVLGSFKEENLGEVWTEILQKLVLCAGCAFCVASADRMTGAINSLILPLYTTILELGARTMEYGKTSTQGFNLGEIFGQLLFAHSNDACAIVPKELSIAALDGGSTNINTLSDCMICRINDRLNVGVQLGINMIVSMRLGALLIGIFVIVLFTAAKLFFVLYLVDALFRLNFAVYLLPVLIMGIPFKFTRKWSKQGLLLFLNSAGIMLFLGMLISIAVRAIEASITGGYDYDSFEGLGTPLQTITLLSILLINIPGMGVAMADKFIGGGMGLEFQKKISKFVMNSLKKAGGAAIGTLSSGATSLMTKAMERHEVTREVLTNIKQKNSSVSNTLNSLAGYNDD
ncbi:MAG: hypothetical protein IJ864_04090 [Alphaproteobacteria bacterium]|nr:hypothetical protein [Alphaproteobacteria bacterium]